jgi:hypothetical protein
VDVPFTDYDDKVAALEPIGPAKRYDMIRKMGLSIALLGDVFGDSSKWKWFFVELEGRCAVIAKNIFDFKNIVRDGRSPNYEVMMYHVRMIEHLLAKASGRYRIKYESVTKDAEDFRRAINFLNALRRVYAILGKTDKVEAIKKKCSVWESKLEADRKAALANTGT